MLPAMKLNDFLTANNIAPASFASRLGVTREALRLWTSGQRTPKQAFMMRIIKETNGAVMPNDFLPEVAE